MHKFSLRRFPELVCSRLHLEAHLVSAQTGWLWEPCSLNFTSPLYWACQKLELLGKCMAGASGSCFPSPICHFIEVYGRRWGDGWEGVQRTCHETHVLVPKSHIPGLRCVREDTSNGRLPPSATLRKWLRGQKTPAQVFHRGPHTSVMFNARLYEWIIIFEQRVKLS